MTDPTNKDVAEALRSVTDLPLGTSLILRLAADRLDPPMATAEECGDPDDGWIKWGGGFCPVPGHVYVECLFDTDSKGPEQGIAHAWRWEHVPGWRNIIAYRVIK